MTGQPIERRPFAVWQGIECEDPPARHFDYPDLRAMAEQLHASRVERFPAMIDAGKIDPAEAAHQLELFRQIAAEWRWICTGEGEVAPLATLAGRRLALDASLRTIAAIAGQRGGFDDDLAEQAGRVIALRWHLTPERAPVTRRLAALTHELRAAHRTQELCHAA